MQVELSVERVHQAVSAAKKHAHMSESIASTMKEEADEDRDVAEKLSKAYSVKRLKVQEELNKILSNITVNGEIPEDVNETVAVASTASSLLETDGNVTASNETAFERQARITLENYRNSMSMRIATDLDILTSANESLSLIDQSINNIRHRVHKLNGLISEALLRVDNIMRKECKHIQSVVHQRILGKEHSVELERRYDGDSNMKRALNALSLAEEKSREALKEHQLEQQNFAVATADLVWIQEHLMDKKMSDADAVDNIEKSRNALKETKKKLQGSMVKIEEERSRFQEVVDESGSFEISAAFHVGGSKSAGSDIQLAAVVKGEEKLVESAKNAAKKANVKSLTLGYECRTDTAKSSKAEALLRQSTMFYEQGQRVEKKCAR